VYLSIGTGDVLGESVGITRSQPTLKSFRVDTNDVVTVQAVERWMCSHVATTFRESGRSGGLEHSLHVGLCVVDSVCAECRSWKTLHVKALLFQPHGRRACLCFAHRREPEVCTDQRCSKCSPGISDTQGVPGCPEVVHVGGVLQ
jgi:hypothetical protein